MQPDFFHSHLIQVGAKFHMEVYSINITQLIERSNLSLPFTLNGLITVQCLLVIIRS